MPTDPPPDEASSSALLDAMPALLFVQDAEGTFLQWRGRRADLKLPPEQFLGRRIRDLFPRPFSDQVERHIQNTLRTGTQERFEYDLESEALGSRTFECRMVPFTAGTVLSLVTDITARKHLTSPTPPGTIRTTADR